MHDTSEETLRAQVVAAVEAGDTDRLAAAARDYLSVAASPVRAARFLKGELESRPITGLRPLSVALLSSFSIELVADPLFAAGLTEKLDLRFDLPGYDLYRQAILDPRSDLYTAPPDVIVLAIDGPRLAPELYNGFITGGWRDGDGAVQRVLEDVAALVRRLREGVPTPILFHGLVPPALPELGIVDPLEQAGQVTLIQRVNDGLGALAREIPGFYPIDLASLVRRIGYDRWHDPRLDLFARSPISRAAMGPLCSTYLRYLRAIAGRSRKCLIVDLDNTLWGGVLGEEGPLGIKLGSEYPGNAFVAFQEALLRLRDRGVLLALASKNNPGDVEEAFRENPAMVLKLDDFSAREVHWEPKSRSVTRIADRLNLGLEHLVFVDDNPAEIAEVARALPQVTVRLLPKQPEAFIDAVFSDGLFDSLSVSAEDRRRAELYRQREAADAMRSEAGSLEDYYRDLDMTVHLAPVTEASLARAAQMTQKTNQFNATTKRYSEADIAAQMAANDWLTLTARVTDRFGDNGIVCLALARRNGDVLDVDTFLMSCRVIGRTVETAVLHRLTTWAEEMDLAAVEGWIRPTARNTPVRDLYERHGFTRAETAADETVRWRRDTEAGPVSLPTWLNVRDETEG